MVSGDTTDGGWNILVDKKFVELLEFLRAKVRDIAEREGRDRNKKQKYFNSDIEKWRNLCFTLGSQEPYFVVKEIQRGCHTVSW